MTRQEIFDKVAAFLLNPETQRSYANGRCLYRGPNGTKCAIGFLIPDECYSKEMEEKSVKRLFNEYGSLFPGMNSDNIIFLNDLQEAHDYSGNWFGDRTYMKRVLKRICENFNLVFKFDKKDV